MRSLNVHHSHPQLEFEYRGVWEKFGKNSGVVERSFPLVAVIVARYAPA
jgi:hypothetical protein